MIMGEDPTTSASHLPSDTQLLLPEILDQLARTSPNHLYMFTSTSPPPIENLAKTTRNQDTTSSSTSTTLCDIAPTTDQYATLSRLSMAVTALAKFINTNIGPALSIPGKLDVLAYIGPPSSLYHPFVILAALRTKWTIFPIDASTPTAQIKVLLENAECNNVLYAEGQKDVTIELINMGLLISYFLIDKLGVLLSGEEEPYKDMETWEKAKNDTVLLLAMSIRGRPMFRPFTNETLIRESWTFPRPKTDNEEEDENGGIANRNGNEMEDERRTPRKVYYSAFPLCSLPGIIATTVIPFVAPPKRDRNDIIVPPFAVLDPWDPNDELTMDRILHDTKQKVCAVYAPSHVIEKWLDVTGVGAQKWIDELDFIAWQGPLSNRAKDGLGQKGVQIKISGASDGY
jgi:hypothetical protein